MVGFVLANSCSNNGQRPSIWNLQQDALGNGINIFKMDLTIIIIIQIVYKVCIKSKRKIKKIIIKAILLVTVPSLYLISCSSSIM